MKARHLYSYTYILSVPKRFTLDVPNNSPQMKTISVLVSSILWPIKNLMSLAKADQIRKKSKNANSYLATSRLKKKQTVYVSGYYLDTLLLNLDLETKSETVKLSCYVVHLISNKTIETENILMNFLRLLRFLNINLYTK